jgi:flagellar FliL protein
MAERKEVEAKDAKGGSKGLVLGLAAMNVVTLGALAAFVLLGQGAKPAPAPAGAEGAPAAGHEAPAKEGGGHGEAAAEGEGEPAGPGEGEAPAPADPGSALGPVVDLGGFVINLNDSGATRYLKATMKAEVSSAAASDEVTKREPQIRDAVISYLSSLTLRETQGARAKATIRENVARRLNNLLTEGEVRQVYFTEFVTQ